MAPLSMFHLKMPFYPRLRLPRSLLPLLTLRLQQHPVQLRPPSPSNPTPAPAETATTSIQITSILYDGLVPSVESDEYVEISNPGTTAVDLNGRTLKAVADGTPSFRFPAYTLEPGTRHKSIY